MAELLEV